MFPSVWLPMFLGHDFLLATGLWGHQPSEELCLLSGPTKRSRPSAGKRWQESESAHGRDHLPPERVTASTSWHLSITPHIPSVHWPHMQPHFLPPFSQLSVCRQLYLPWVSPTSLTFQTLLPQLSDLPLRTVSLSNFPKLPWLWCSSMPRTTSHVCVLLLPDSANLLFSFLDTNF